MKKVSLMIAALALVLGLSQCKKQEEPVANGQKQHIELTANNGNGGSKVSGSISGADFDLSWQEGDEITVSGGATSDEPLKLSSGAGYTSATFRGDITKVSDDDIVFTVGTIDYMLQGGTAEWIGNNVKLEGKSVFKEDGKYSVDMELPYAVLKLDVSAFASNAKDGGVVVTIKSGNTELASVEGITADSKAVYVALPVVAGSTKYTLVGNGKIAEKTWELAANTFFTAADEHGQPTGEAFVIETVTYHETVSFYGTPGIEWSVCNLGATNGETAASWCGGYYQWAGGNTAIEAWGTGWRRPTKDEWVNLGANNTAKWLGANQTDSGTGFKAPPVNGLLVVKGGKNGNTLDNSVYMFLPLSGYYSSSHTTLNCYNDITYYLSSTLASSGNYYGLFIDWGNYKTPSWQSYNSSSSYYPVRPVYSEPEQK